MNSFTQLWLSRPVSEVAETLEQQAKAGRVAKKAVWMPGTEMASYPQSLLEGIATGQVNLAAGVLNQSVERHPLPQVMGNRLGEIDR